MAISSASVNTTPDVDTEVDQIDQITGNPEKKKRLAGVLTASFTAAALSLLASQVGAESTKKSEVLLADASGGKNVTDAVATLDPAQTIRERLTQKGFDSAFVGVIGKMYSDSLAFKNDFKWNTEIMNVRFTPEEGRTDLVSLLNTVHAWLGHIAFNKEKSLKDLTGFEKVTVENLSQVVTVLHAYEPEDLPWVPQENRARVIENRVTQGGRWLEAIEKMTPEQKKESVDALNIAFSRLIWSARPTMQLVVTYVLTFATNQDKIGSSPRVDANLNSNIASFEILQKGNDGQSIVRPGEVVKVEFAGANGASETVFFPSKNVFSRSEVLNRFPKYQTVNWIDSLKVAYDKVKTSVEKAPEQSRDVIYMINQGTRALELVQNELMPTLYLYDQISNGKGSAEEKKEKIAKLKESIEQKVIELRSIRKAVDENKNGFYDEKNRKSTLGMIDAFVPYLAPAGIRL